MNRTAITPKREEDYAKWYQEVIKAADLAENSVVRGCMVIKQWGYAIWENIQRELDKKIKATGHHNFYFPMFVPLSLMSKEAKHVKGFAKECAVVTHHRLELDDNDNLVPTGELEDPLVVRPTSEVIIGESYAKWIKSYRDLPLLGNQWANVVRWEMRPRVFLRTTEFLWQEGHTAHATKDEAIEEAEKMLEVYRELVEDFLAMSIVVGEKTANEKFPGADVTYCLEGMMQDHKALQLGTSHFLGQNFAKAFDIKFLSKEGKQEHVWTTSWGVTTRLIGGLIMMHSDDDGLILPPKVAPLHVIIIPLIKEDDLENAKIIEYCNTLKKEIIDQIYNNENVRVEVDIQDKRAGDKVWSWIKKGVPIRLEIGQKEISTDSVFMGRRDKEVKDKQSILRREFISNVGKTLYEIQDNIYRRTSEMRKKHTLLAQSEKEFYDMFSSVEKEKNVFALAHWIGDDKTEEKLKNDLKVTPRCIPLETKEQKGKCIFSGADNAPLTLFARAY